MKSYALKIIYLLSCLHDIGSCFKWWSGLVGNVVGRINEVNQRRARLVLDY